MKRVLTGAGALLLLATAACGGTSSGTTSTSYKGNTIKLGAVFSLTGLGGVYGPQSKNAALLAQDDINAKGGVNGATIQLTVVDDGSDKTQAAQQTQTLIQEDGVIALLGPTLSNSAVAAHPVADSLKTPMMGTSNTGLNIVGTCPYPCDYIFRDSLGEQDAIPANIKTYADAKHPKTGVVLYPNDDKFSSDGAQIVNDTAPKYGIKIVKTIQFTKNEADLSPYVTEAVAANPDVIFITSLGGIPAKIMTTARADGWQGQFLGGNGFNTAAVSKQAGQAGLGAQSGSAWYPGINTQSNRDFIAHYKAKYGADPDQLAAQAYTGVMILADAASRANLTFKDVAKDRTSMRDAMLATNLSDTPLGPFKFTSSHDVKQTIYVVAMDGKGGFTLVSTVPL